MLNFSQQKILFVSQIVSAMSIFGMGILIQQKTTTDCDGIIFRTLSINPIP